MKNNQADNGKTRTAEHRLLKRHAVHWKVVIIYKKDGKDATFHGQTYDLSLGGACIYSDENIYVEEPVVMSIKVRTKHSSQKVIGVKCQMLYNIISSNYGKFRIGIQFIEFNADGKEVLADALSRLPMVKKEEVREEEIREEEIRKKAAKDRLEQEIRNQLEIEIRAQMQNEIKERLEDEIKVRLETEIRDRLEKENNEKETGKASKSGRLNHG